MTLGEDEEVLLEEKLSMLDVETKKNTNLERLQGRILNVHEDYRTNMCNPKLGKDRNKYTDRANRAVSEQVLDPRIRTILLKLINNGYLYEINGCISTGKEANVYHAMTETGEHRAIKIYKSTILTFKNRDRYVTGEYRFRTGYARSNPRKMTATWAEKEMRNLKRLEAVGIPCPTVFHLKAQVLLMNFIPDSEGSEWPAPRLKDATGDIDFSSLYVQCLRMMRKLYHECHLVHADLSEYNLLVAQEGTQLVMIDVSQSVEHDHPNALTFLRHDCRNIVAFFKAHNVPVPSIRGLFEYVTTNVLPEKGDQEEYILHTLPGEHPENDMEDSHFENILLPQSISQVNEREPEGFEIYQKMTNRQTQISFSTVQYQQEQDQHIVESDLSSDEETSDGTDDGTDGDESSNSSSSSSDEEEQLTEEQLKEKKKEHKALVKEENRERRQTKKIPKHIKKKATKKRSK